MGVQPAPLALPITVEGRTLESRARRCGQDNADDIGDNSNEMGNNLPAINLGSGRKAVGVSCGSYHCCAALSDGAYKCWGANGNGQLGYDRTDHLGNAAGEMAALGDVNVGTPTNLVVQITAGGRHNCARLWEGSVKCTHA